MADDLERIVQAAMQDLARITRLQPSSVTGVEPAESGWHIQVEMLEKESIPRGMDILGLYDVWLDGGGSVLRFERRSTHRRADVSGPNG